jgi:murein DD-endopeptidase MepM/ murein hydrolase activator NlpD
LRKRYYIFIVSHDWDGQLRRVPIQVQWVVLFVVFAGVGAMTLMGLAGSYLRMLTKVQRFNELRSQQEVLVRQLDSTRQDVAQSRAEVASLGSLASQISALYNFDRHAGLEDKLRELVADNPAAAYSTSIENFRVLEAKASDGSLRLDPIYRRPSIWPVLGPITSSFGERSDPFDGEGEFHTGVDIGSRYRTAVHATADGLVVFAGYMNGFGRVVILDHGRGVRTLYAHLSSFAVTVGQDVQRGETIGSVGESGRTTGPHLHYEVRINNVSVNPHQFLPF